MTHDVTRSLQTGQVFFTPRSGLLTKAVGLIQERIQEDSCTPAQASKIRGVLGFPFTGMYGRIGRGPLLQRQCSDHKPWSLSPTLRRALGYLIDTMHVIQPRGVLLYKDPMPPLAIAASDGRQDESAPPFIAALFFDPGDGKRIAVAVEITQDLMEVWAAPTTASP